MDSETAKNMIARVRQSDLDEDEQDRVISMIKDERASGKPAAYISVSGNEDGMGGMAKLTLGERTPVRVVFRDPEWLDELDDLDEDEEDPVEIPAEVYLELTRLGDEINLGEGTGSTKAYDDDLILADYHLSYGQGKALLRLLGVERIGTPGDVGTTLRTELGLPEDVNPILRDIQENGVRGWRTL